MASQNEMVIATKKETAEGVVSLGQAESSKTFTIENILNSEELILIDGCIKGYGVFSWNIYEKTRLADISSKEVKNEIKAAQEFIEILKHPNTYTIKEVSKELKDFNQIISNKIKSIGGHRKIPWKKRRQINFYEENNKKLLSELQNLTYNLYKTSKKKQIKINDPQYETLLEMVKLVEKEIRIKKDRGIFYNEQERDRSHDSDTDEKLALTTCYLSLFSKKSPCLLSRDGDLVGLLKLIPKIIGATVFLPENSDFREKLKSNPFRLYHGDIDGENYKIPIDSSKITYDTEFYIKNTPFSENLKAKRKMFQLWAEFAQAPSQTPKHLS